VLRTLIISAGDLPTADTVYLLDYFTRPQARTKELAQWLRKANANTSITEQDAADIMCKRFLYVKTRNQCSTSRYARVCTYRHWH
jgi:hypothetical protein